VKWFSKEPWFERFFKEPYMVLLWHHSEEPFLVPDVTFMFLCVYTDYNEINYPAALAIMPSQ